jgi:TorA maturation chaperone TorD
MGFSTMEVIKTYEQEGLGKSSDFKALPDHIVVEMEFMSFLIYQELAALEKRI